MMDTHKIILLAALCYFGTGVAIFARSGALEDSVNQTAAHTHGKPFITKLFAHLTIAIIMNVIFAVAWPLLLGLRRYHARKVR